MNTKRKNADLRNGQRGMSIFVVAMSMVALLGMAALAMDLSTLYLARNEAQRAADAAALAGAKAIVDSGYLNGAATTAAAQDLAVQEATAIGEQNTVGGQTASVSFANPPVDFTTYGQNPRITVIVQRTQANGNAMPTFFGKILGFMSADISATATAEAYTPSIGGGSIGNSSKTICLKPWLLPNCDPQHASPANSNCSGDGYFVNPGTGAVANSGTVSSGGVIGELLTLTPASNPLTPAPQQFSPLQVPAGGSTICPSSAGGGDTAFQTNTECCNTTQFFCGQVAHIDPSAGNIAAQIVPAVENLINQNGSGNGQDILNTSSYPFQIMGGSGNPNSALMGASISSSNSIVTVPLYSGSAIPSGGPVANAATILGFAQLFVKDVNTTSGAVDAYVMGATGCCVVTGCTGASNVTALLGATGSSYPVRLVKPQ